MRSITVILCALVVVLGSPAAIGQVESPMQVRVDGFYDFVHDSDVLDGLSHDERARRVQIKYDKTFGTLFDGDGLDAVSQADTHLAFKAAYMAAFENPRGPAYLDALKALHKLGADASDRELRWAQGMLFQARRFDRLAALDATYATRGLTQPPDVKLGDDPVAHEVLVYDGTQLTSRTVDIAHGPWLVVVGHPLCHFTRNAISAIERSPSLTKVMRHHSVWMSPPDQNMDFTPFVQWRDAHPEAPISTAYSYAGWPQLGTWGTPTFYFFVDGKVVDKVVGWPKGGHMDELKAGLAKIGLIKP